MTWKVFAPISLTEYKSINIRSRRGEDQHEFKLLSRNFHILPKIR